MNFLSLFVIAITYCFSMAHANGPLKPDFSLVEITAVTNTSCWNSEQRVRVPCDEPTYDIVASPRRSVPMENFLKVTLPVLPQGCFAQFPGLTGVKMLAENLGNKILVRLFGEMSINVSSSCVGFPPRYVELTLKGYTQEYGLAGGNAKNSYLIKQENKNNYYQISFDKKLEGDCELRKCEYAISNVKIESVGL